MPAYEIRHLTKQYPRRADIANDDISLTIDQGEFFGLLGDNGAGKTTLVRQMANLLKPTSGEIWLAGKRLDTAFSLYASQQIGYMPQGSLALNNTTVGEALYFTAHLRGFSRHDARRERDRLLELLPLGSLRDVVTPKLSGGQKRLLLLATSMATSPPIIILDEPTNELAPQNRTLVWDILREMNLKQGTTMILVTHNVLEAEKVIQRVGIMQAGRLIAVGRPGALKAELNQKLRLEIVFSPDVMPILPESAQVRSITPGRIQLLIERHEAVVYLDALETQSTIEDFRLSTATLEDLYLSLLVNSSN